jgi:hypothetical protein
MDKWIDSYMSILETLQWNLIDHANMQCSVIMHHILDIVTELCECFLYVFSQNLHSKMVHRGLASVQ